MIACFWRGKNSHFLCLKHPECMIVSFLIDSLDKEREIYFVDPLQA
jgi:hypothetical protein